MNQTLHTEGRWRLVLDTGLKEEEFRHYIEHHCGENRHYSKVWIGMRYRYRYFEYPCSWCEESVPKGLQALFVLLTDDQMETLDDASRRHHRPCP